MDGDRGDADLGGASRDANRDLAPIGDQEAHHDRQSAPGAASRARPPAVSGRELAAGHRDDLGP